MQRPLRLLLLLALAAVAVPLVPFLAFGTRLDHLVAGWLDPPPAAPMLAALEVGVLAADLLLPVPSSMVATLGGATLGIAAGTACGWLGMTLGAAVGWAVGRAFGSRAVTTLDAADRRKLDRRERRYGPLVIVVTRPVPLLAEAVAILAGAAGMPFRTFLPWTAAGNLAVAAAWSAAGALGKELDAVQWMVAGSLVLPVVLAWFASRRPGTAAAG